MEKYARAAYDRELYLERLARAYGEMISDPNSKYHGGAYSVRGGCPCTCEKCTAKKQWYLEKQRIRNRNYRIRMKEERGRKDA